MLDLDAVLAGRTRGHIRKLHAVAVDADLEVHGAVAIVRRDSADIDEFGRILQDHPQFAENITQIAKERYDLTVSADELMLSE